MMVDGEPVARSGDRPQQAVDGEEDAVCGVSEGMMLAWHSVICLMMVAGVLGVMGGCVLWDWLMR